MTKPKLKLTMTEQEIHLVRVAIDVRTARLMYHVGRFQREIELLQDLRKRLENT